MVRASTLWTALATITSVFAADQTCSLTNKCPASAPCCSQYGVCGVGAYCLGGCDPRMSNTLDSCVPAPVCKSKTYTWSDLTGITSKTAYLGDASKTDWVMDGEAVAYQNTLLLTMAPGTVGTVLATSDYMWYGSVEVVMKTSRGAGVVTAFILMSDVKDEIDYEFVGNQREDAQSNYYWQGITNYDQGQNISLSDTFLNYHTYRIDWTPDTLSWYVDGQLGRTRKRSDTWNATAQAWAYPQTPARVQLSIWPGGLASNAPGTITWAGGPIDWSSNAPDIAANGYYYAQFKSVKISCYDAKTAPGTNLHTSYTYNNLKGTNDTVIDGDNPTVLSSFLGTGTNMSAVPASSQTAEVAVVPGLTGSGPGVAPVASGSSSDSGSSGSSGSDATAAAAPASTQTGWSQGLIGAQAVTSGVSGLKLMMSLVGGGFVVGLMTLM